MRESMLVPTARRLAVIGALVAALALAGCGRKGALDPPPGAATEPPPSTSCDHGASRRNADIGRGRPPIAPASRKPCDLSCSTALLD